MPNRQIQNLRKHRITILRPSLHTQCVLWVWWVKLFCFPSYVEFKMFFLLDPLKIQREKKVSWWNCLSIFFFHLHAVKFTLFDVELNVVVQSCLTLCDPMDCSMPGFPVHHQLPEFAQTHVHWVSDAIQLSSPLSPPSPLALHLSQHQLYEFWQRHGVI